MASPALASFGVQWQGEGASSWLTPVTASGSRGAEVASVGTGKGRVLTMIHGFVFGNDFI